MVLRLPLVALIAAALAAPPVVPAAVFLETSVEDVARTSDAVLRGRVASRTSFFTRDRRAILTEVVIVVAEAWKGAPPAEVRVIVPGGTVGDLAQRVDAVPSFRDGEDAVVFLSRRGEHWELNGFALAKYRVDGARAVPDLRGALFQGSAVKPGERRVGEMDVGELRRRVAEAAR